MSTCKTKNNFCNGTNGPNLTLRTCGLSDPLLTENLNGVTVTNRFDYLGRRTNCTILDPQSTVLASTTFNYDPASRLHQVSDATHSATGDQNHCPNDPWYWPRRSRRLDGVILPPAR
jgi:hypothetical protein